MVDPLMRLDTFHFLIECNKRVHVVPEDSPVRILGAIPIARCLEGCMYVLEVRVICLTLTLLNVKPYMVFKFQIQIFYYTRNLN